MNIKTQVVQVIDGQEVTQIQLFNDRHVGASFLTLGATWQEFFLPDGRGASKNVLIGFDKPSTYVSDPLCAGQSIGRVAGRIDGGKFSLDGVDYQLPKNENGNCLHGGPQGFQKQIWDYRLEEGQEVVRVIMTYRAKESCDGFPGDMTVRVCFSLDNHNRLTIQYDGFDASQPTIFNPTNHVYFNLSHQQDLSTHELTLFSDSYLETRYDLVPTGKMIEVTDTVYDFRQAKNLNEAIIEAGGFDDVFLVEPSLATPQGVLKEKSSGDVIAFYSDRPAWVMYTMGGIPSTIYPSRDKGQSAKEFEAIALEAQCPPDAINHDNFGDIILRPNEIKSTRIVFEYRNDR